MGRVKVYPGLGSSFNTNQRLSLSTKGWSGISSSAQGAAYRVQRAVICDDVTDDVCQSGLLMHCRARLVLTLTMVQPEDSCNTKRFWVSGIIVCGTISSS